MKAKFIVTGEKLHEVGYRASIIERAVSLGLDRFSTFNSEIDGKQAVIVLMEGEEAQVSAIRDFLNTYAPARAIVEGMREEKYRGKVPAIERTMQSFEMEQWSKGIPILLDIRNNTQLIPEIAENTRLIPEIAENTRAIRERQEEHIAITKSGFESIARELGSFKELHEEIRELRVEFERIKESVARIERKIEV